MKDFDFEPESSADTLQGHVLMPRALTELSAWKKTPADTAHAICDLYMLANRTPGQHTLERGLVVDYVVGECLWSNKGLAARWGWQRDSVEKFMVELEKSEIITRRPVGQYGKVIKLTDYVTQPAAKPHRNHTETTPNPQPSSHPSLTVGASESTERVEEPAAPFPEQVSDATMLEFGRAFAGELESGTPRMTEDWLVDIIARINGRNTPPRDWKRFMVAMWRREFRGFKPANGATPATNGHSGEAVWKKLRDLDAKIKDLDVQIVGFENTQPELAERLEVEVKKMRAERKELSE